MKYNFLGDTELEVSKVILGCMSFGSPNWREWVIGSDQSMRLMKKAFDLGINFFDTANVYSSGKSEEILGRFLKENNLRDQIIVSTKMFYPSPETPNLIGLTKENILSSIDGSLKRLNVERIDLYQVHRWDTKTPIEETMDALHQVIKSGKARYIGASNMRCWQLAKAQIVAKEQGWQGFVCMQNHYNLLHREDERDLIPFIKDQGMGLIPWSPLARGRIARAGSKSAKTERGSEDENVQNILYGDTYDPVLDDVVFIAKKYNIKPAEVGISWLIHKGANPIIGVTKENHLLDAISATVHDLVDDDFIKLERSYTPRKISELPWSPKEIEDPRRD